MAAEEIEHRKPAVVADNRLRAQIGNTVGAENYCQYASTIWVDVLSN